MLFDDQARTKLEAIIEGAAIGETVGLLASRMSEAERAEKLTPEGILQISRQSNLTSTSAEMLRATIRGLEAADAIGSPSNLDILIHVHQAYREWAMTSPLAYQLRNIRMIQAILSGQLGSFSSMERGGCDGMLCVAPIGLAFADDPGRAFEIGAKTANLSDGDFNSGLAAGVVTLLFALIEQGISTKEAILDILSFIRPLDWQGEVSSVLRSVLDEEAMIGCHSPICSELRTALIAILKMGPADSALANHLASISSGSAALEGQLVFAVRHTPLAADEDSFNIHAGWSVGCPSVVQKQRV